MKIAVASDHAGYRYKALVAAHLRRAGHEVADFGTSSTDAVDYPDFVHPAARAVASGRCERGVLLGGSGNGEAMAANRHAGVRCAVCWNVDSARLARAHNDANMIALGERLMPPETALAIVDTWLATTFEGGRHVPRIRKLDEDGDDRPRQVD